MRIPIALFSFLALIQGLVAQAASFRYVGTSCNLHGVSPFLATLSASARPVLGTTMRLTYKGPNHFRQGQYGNWSSAVAYMLLGFRNPQVAVGRCALLSSAEVIIAAPRNISPWDVPLAIPNDPRLLGFKLHAQAMFTYINVVCLFSCRTYTDTGATNGVELILGR